ncbi:uncharacterized protein LY79DRAFT_573046 [Colletotrichum navitas]|uniref:Uncharacterized protein n=1 Tax=Colletotrichum navitas TaxID=681940 RepID=A0AAD8PJK5_9PEZI|nr:uncharacterized protein LY79DRAFT_573046 [Colletotrichum navitas]KAK1565972.1 hypothetical protein LY79DRAFT_573046 [Colletotrichum navitas]
MSSSIVLRIPPLDVVAVCEDKDGRQHEFIDRAFKFSSAHLAPKSFCLRLSDTVSGGDCDDTVIYLQITPEHLDSMSFEFCRSNDARLPHLDSVRRQQGCKGDLARLRFQLRDSIHAQFIVPKNFPDYEALDSPARCTFDIVASLAVSPSFSLYLPANKLSKQLLNSCVNAVKNFPTLTGKELSSYQRAVDLHRLYRGTGGKVLATGDYNRSARADKQRNRSTSPVTTESCATTVDFDTVPRHQGSPPEYGECVTEGKKSRTISNDAANFVEKSIVDCAPPKYSETEQSRNVSGASKRVWQCGNEDVLLHPSPKRVLSQDSFTTISAPAAMGNARRLETKLRPESDDADINDHILLRNLMRQIKQQEEQIKYLRQDQQSKQRRQEKIIKQLQDDVEKLRRYNTDLEGRYRALEEMYDDLAQRQDQAEGALESLDVHFGELEGFCGKLDQQIPNVSDELEDLVRVKMSDMWGEYMGDSMEHLGDLVKEHIENLFSEYMGKESDGNLGGRLREYVRKNVTTQMAEMKAKMREALQE